MKKADGSPSLPPKINTPSYWPATPDEVRGALKRSGAAVTTIGKSAGGRDIYGTVIDATNPVLTFGVIGGTHGHESGGTAAAINMIFAAETGKDLIGNAAADIISRVRWAVVPLLNPDGRIRCANSFVGMTSQDINYYCSGWDQEGHLVRRQNRISVSQPGLHLGGLYNDDGVDILNATDGTPSGTDSVEVAAAASFLKEAGCGAVIDLHAHAFNFLFYTPLDEVPEAVAKRGFEIAEKVRAEANQSGFAIAAPECVASGQTLKAKVPSCTLYHNVTGALPFLLEGSQGAIGTYKCYYGGGEKEIRDPGYTHRQIVEGYLFALASIARHVKP